MARSGPNLTLTLTMTPPYVPRMSPCIAEAWTLVQSCREKTWRPPEDVAAVESKYLCKR